MYFRIRIEIKSISNSLTNPSITYPMDFQIETDRLEGFAVLITKFSALLCGYSFGYTG